MPYQLLAVLGMLGVGGNAVAGGDSHAAAGHVEGLLQAGADLLGHRQRLLREAHASEQHEELVAAESRHGIGIAHAGLEASTNLLQEKIPDGVPESIIHRFKQIQIQEEQGQSSSVPSSQR
jgi:hypothetical protein